MQTDSTILCLWTLHQELRAIAPGISPESLRQAIRDQLPAVDIGPGLASPELANPELANACVRLPHKKTPQGRTRVLHMNYTRNRAGETVECEIEHLKFFAQTAQAIGICLEILVHSPHRADVDAIISTPEYANLDTTIIESPQPISKWAEDSVEFLDEVALNGDALDALNDTRNNTRSDNADSESDGIVPTDARPMGPPTIHAAVLTPLYDDLLEWAMKEGRRQRWTAHVAPDRLEAMLEDDHLWIPLGIRVNSSETGQERERVLQAQGHPVGHIRAYIEGGNMIAGEDAAGRDIILVGMDAIATTACLYQISHDNVLQVIADDFGLAPDQIIAIEQPGQFHLDMGLLFLGNGRVVLNDSQIAFENAQEMAELAPCTTTETMAEKLQLQCALEAIAARDLTAAGLTVIRKSLESAGIYNFFNGEFVEGQDGYTYYLTNGGPSDQQDAFARLMMKEWQVVKQVFFSPPQAASKSLQEKGGVGCRLKGSEN